MRTSDYTGTYDVALIDDADRGDIVPSAATGNSVAAASVAVPSSAASSLPTPPVQLHQQVHVVQQTRPPQQAPVPVVSTPVQVQVTSGCVDFMSGPHSF